MNQAVYWPYDEVTLEAGQASDEIVVKTPWLATAAVLEGDHAERARHLVGKFEEHRLGPSDLGELNWFFRPLSKFPFCYQLPRAQWPQGLDKFEIRDRALLAFAPRESFKWDAEAAVAFSTSTEGIDPVSLFSVARRFHLLSTIEENKTARLFARVAALKAEPEKFARAAALIVRQNHYVTERCNDSLTPALCTAMRARQKVEAFIQAEYGHDRLLRSAMLTLTADPHSVPVTNESKTLMDLLKFSAERNFLAFAMVVDAFERSPYQDSDPLARLIAEGGFTAAARQIERHHQINDAGEHENVALSFLESMGPISAEYATEALRIAEVATRAMNATAHGVEQLLC